MSSSLRHASDTVSLAGHISEVVRASDDPCHPGREFETTAPIWPSSTDPVTFYVHTSDRGIEQRFKVTVAEVD